MTQVPSTIWRTLSYRQGGQELPKDIDAAWDTLVGLAGRLVPRRTMYLHRARRIVALEKQLADCSDAVLRETALEFRELFRCGRDRPEDLVRAFALVREVAFRQIGERPFPVQVAGALSLEAGCITEMATGEGKTLTATLPATVAGWRGKGCHIITVNDYLAQRDAEWMSPIFSFCGLRVAFITQGMDPPDRREAYRADITYCTNKEVTADFLRDRLALGRLRGLSSALLTKIAMGRGTGTDRLVQRGLHYAIVDEADSVLIDEAVTPLIISGEAPNPEQVEAFQQAAELAEQLEPRRHYTINERYREVELTEAGKRRLEELVAGLGGVWAGKRRREELVVQALTARVFYVRDKQYVIQDDKVVLVGRVAHIDFDLEHGSDVQRVRIATHETRDSMERLLDDLLPGHRREYYYSPKNNYYTYIIRSETVNDYTKEDFKDSKFLFNLAGDYTATPEPTRRRYEKFLAASKASVPPLIEVFNLPVTGETRFMFNSDFASPQIAILRKLFADHGLDLIRAYWEPYWGDSSVPSSICSVYIQGELSRKIEELESEGLSCRILVDTKSGNLILGCISSPKGKYEVKW